MEDIQIPLQDEIWNDPNKYARKASYELLPSSIKIHGYQEFTITANDLVIDPIDKNLEAKYSLLKPYLKPRYMARRTLLDLGGNSGFYSLVALKNDALKAIVNETDLKYIEILNAIKNNFDLTALEINQQDITDLEICADNVLALAIIHWIYSCTATYGSLDLIFEKLASLTNYMLIVEWVDPEDSAIQMFKHLEWNKQNQIDTYTFGNFLGGMEKHFDHWQKIGDITQTRSLYAAYKKTHEVDLSIPFELVTPIDKVISSRMLTTVQNVPFWSIVYDKDGTILKQATGDLAYREGKILSMLKSGYFPNVFEFKQLNNISEVIMEKIDGTPLENYDWELLISDLPTFEKFIKDCLIILKLLRDHKILHRDIRPANVMMRDKKPVLIDFGWAEASDYPSFTPEALGEKYRPADLRISDLYSMGMLISKINNHRFYQVDDVLSFIINPDPDLNVQTVEEASILFELAFAQANTKIELESSFWQNLIKKTRKRDIANSNLQQVVTTYNQKIASFIGIENDNHKLQAQIEIINDQAEKTNNELEIVQEKLIEAKQYIKQMQSELSLSHSNEEKLAGELEKINYLHADRLLEIEALYHESDALRHEVLKYELSDSWKLTRPLRKLMYLVRGKK